jgi:hypothetical protein
MDSMQGQITATTYVDVDLVYDRMVMMTRDLGVCSGYWRTWHKLFFLSYTSFN